MVKATTFHTLIHKASTSYIQRAHTFTFTQSIGTELKMYVTRPLSLYRNFPGALSREPPEGPYTGYLVITDEEADARETNCWGVCRSRRIKKLPFPQDKILSVVYSSDHDQETVVKTKAWFIPVLDQPLSSNCYYVIKAKGSRKGYAISLSKHPFINWDLYAD